MRRVLYAVALAVLIGAAMALVMVTALAQPKSLPATEVVALRFTCESGVCTMPVSDLRVLVDLARGARGCQ